MILPGEQGALQGSRLMPHAQNAIASLVDSRVCVVSRTPYTVFNPGDTATLGQFTFPADTLGQGSVIRVWAAGTLKNNTGSAIPFPFNAAYQQTQPNPVTITSFPPSIISDPSPRAWRYCAAFMLGSTTGAGGVQFSKTKQAAQGNLLAVGVQQEMLIGNAQVSSNTVSTTAQQFPMAITQNPLTLFVDPALPVNFSFYCIVPSPGDLAFAVHSAYMEAI